jgi:predicted RNA binding protein YcfA (HicA-like mRNA interferase family)
VTNWPAAKARRVLAALLRTGRVVKRQSGPHRTLSRADRPDFVFAFHEDEELGPRILSRIAKHTGLTPDDLKRDRIRWRAVASTRPNQLVNRFQLALFWSTILLILQKPLNAKSLVGSIAPICAAVNR